MARLTTGQDAALQGDPQIRRRMAESFAVLDFNLEAVGSDGASAQRDSAEAWTPVMQKIWACSEAERLPLGIQKLGVVMNALMRRAVQALYTARER